MTSPSRFTAEKKRRFLDLLRETGNVSLSARAVDASRHGVYDHRKVDAAFAADWDEALEEAIDTLEHEARRRALHGVEEPVFYRGEACGAVQKYSDTLLIFLLKGNRDKYRDRLQADVNMTTDLAATIREGRKRGGSEES